MKKEEGGGNLLLSKAFLIFLSIASGIKVFVLLETHCNIYLKLLALLIVSYSYSILSGYAIHFCCHLKQWANGDKDKEWSMEDKIFFGSFWPITLLFSLIIFTFLRIINSLYDTRY